MNIVEEKYNKSKVEEDISLLHQKIDATNDLLKTIVLILEKVINDKYK